MFFFQSYLIWLIFSISIFSFLTVFFFSSFVGSYGSMIFISINSFFLLLISIYIFIFFLKGSNLFFDYDIGTWFSIGILDISFGIRIDALSSTMLVVITSISFFAQIYSIEYMYYDPHRNRFFAYLSMFTFFMLILVCSNNLVLLFVGWEGVGICSYLLINFWYLRVEANKSSILAVVTNKIGDIFLLIGITFLHKISLSTDFLFFNNFFEYIKTSNYILFLDFNTNYFINIINLSTFFFIVACVGKSAQFGLHIWLPEAMEGPTPVSSLIHAATMVTAGIYLILRLSTFFNYVPNSLSIILFIGSFTTLFASSIGLVQSDLKKVVAYSTCSQLGYMFMGCGFCSYNVVIFHLFIHAFFKALLFLTAGYMIHLLINEQDTRKMGGLLKIAPFPYVTMGIGSFALIGFPFFSGFYSKEKIIESLILISPNINNNVFFIAILFSYTTLILTIIYSFKIYYDIFFDLFNGFKFFISNISYSEILIVMPLFFLSVLSIYNGFLFNDAMVGISTDFWGSSFRLINSNIMFDFFDYNTFFFNDYSFVDSKLISESEWLNVQWIVPFWTFYYIIIIFFLKYYYKEHFLIFKNLDIKYIYFLYNSLLKKYIYINRILIFPCIKKIYIHSYIFFYRFLEKTFLERIGGFGIYNNIYNIIKIKIKKRTFLLYHYLGIIIVAIIFFIFFFI